MGDRAESSKLLQSWLGLSGDEPPSSSSPGFHQVVPQHKRYSHHSGSSEGLGVSVSGTRQGQRLGIKDSPSISVYKGFRNSGPGLGGRD